MQLSDTQILDRILGAMKVYAQQQSPLSPKNAASLVECAEYDRGCKRETYTNGTSFSDQTVSNALGIYQRFWRCVHHPEAIANWSHGQGWHCEHGCDTNDLRWFDHGINQCDTETSSSVTGGGTSGSAWDRTWEYGSGWGGQLSTSSASAGGMPTSEHRDGIVPRGTSAQADIAKADVSHLTTPECIWTLAKPPKGIAPQAFSWWDCNKHRRYGYPVDRICDVCGRELRLVSDECKPAT